MDGLEIPVLDAPRRLARHDKRSDFTCGNDELDTWFHRYAWHNQRANNAVTYVCQQSWAYRRLLRASGSNDSARVVAG